MNIYLVGLPGSGKSTLGKKLAKLMHFSFVDTDDLICKKEEGTIENIFDEHGEKYFRELEQSILKEISQKTSFVVSTGGGTPCFFDNMEIINDTGISIFLDVPVDTIADRLFAQSTENRPMMRGKNKQELTTFLDQKLMERKAYYSRAKIILSDNDISAEDIIKEVEKLK